MTEKIYFCQIGRDGPIKIGITLYPASRINTIRSCNPSTVRCLGTIANQSKDDEKAILLRFRDSRIRGEWFSPTPELLGFIADNSTNEYSFAINVWKEEINA